MTIAVCQTIAEDDCADLCLLKAAFAFACVTVTDTEICLQGFRAQQGFRNLETLHSCDVTDHSREVFDLFCVSERVCRTAIAANEKYTYAYENSISAESYRHFKTQVRLTIIHSHVNLFVLVAGFSRPFVLIRSRCCLAISIFFS